MNWKKSIEPFLNSLEHLKPIPAALSPKIYKDNSIKAVAFDIYGTLLISASGDIDEAILSTDNLRLAFEATSASLPSEQDFLATVLNHFRNEIDYRHRESSSARRFPEVNIIKVWSAVFERMKPFLTPPADIGSFAFIFELLGNKVFPMPGLGETITSLTDRKVLLGLVSNAQFYTPIVMNWFLNRKLEKTDFVAGFCPELQIFSYREKRSKPDVALFQKLVNALRTHHRLTPQECLYVGNDMLKDVWAAHTVGLKTALFGGDNRSLRMRQDDELASAVAPDFIITKLEQVLEIIEEGE